MRYQYYPGCSLEATAMEYNISTQMMMKQLGVELMEIEGWTCCGASAAESVSSLLSLALPARNLALAEQVKDVTDILVPCSACYLNLKKVEEKTKKEPGLLEKLNTILSEEKLVLHNDLHVRHLLDVLAMDVGRTAIEMKIKKPLSGLLIAPYYGCQCLRPYAVFDDPEIPTSMEPLIQATGAAVHPWKAAGQCCGASHMNTDMDVGLELVASILNDAKGADAIVTVCPMCQMNLEAYQHEISKKCKEDVSITILYLPQLIGLAMGLSEKELMIGLNLSVKKSFQEKVRDDGDICVAQARP